jgi:rhodanese-related sulfurtransferase
VPIKKGKEEGSIDIATFNTIATERPESVYLIDVRDPDEFARGSIEGSINIPVDKLEKQVKTLKSDKPIVFICSTGARSGESYYMLQDLRKDLKEVYYLESGLTIKKDGSYTIQKTKE